MGIWGQYFIFILLRIQMQILATSIPYRTVKKLEICSETADTKEYINQLIKKNLGSLHPLLILAVRSGMPYLFCHRSPVKISPVEAGLSLQQWHASFPGLQSWLNWNGCLDADLMAILCSGSGPVLYRIRILPLSTDKTGSGSGSCLVKYTSWFHRY